MTKVAHTRSIENKKPFICDLLGNPSVAESGVELNQVA